MISLDALYGALIGGLVTGLFSLVVINITHGLDLEKQKKAEESLQKSLLKSICSEIGTLWEIYQKGMGEQIEQLKEGEALLLIYPVTQDYFTVYNSNSFLIGRVKDDELRKLIVKTYTQAKGLIDTYRCNNSMLEKYENWQLLNQQTSNDIFQRQADAQMVLLINYASGIKKAHNEIKEEVSALLKKLK